MPQPGRMNKAAVVILPRPVVFLDRQMKDVLSRSIAAQKFGAVWRDKPLSCPKTGPVILFDVEPPQSGLALLLSALIGSLLGGFSQYLDLAIYCAARPRLHRGIVLGLQLGNQLSRR